MNRLLGYLWSYATWLSAWVMAYAMYARFPTGRFSGIGVVSLLWFSGWLFFARQLIGTKSHFPGTFPVQLASA